VNVVSLNDSIRRPIDLMGNPTSSAWCEEALSRAAEMFTLLRWLEGDSTLENKGPLIQAVEAHLEAARQGAHEHRRSFRRTMTGAVIERTIANLDAAEVHLLHLAPADYLRSNMSNLLRQAQRQLEPDDPRYARLEYLAGQADMRNLTHEERNFVTAFLGMLLVRAQFIPGLSALDSSAQIIAWSVVLGYAQQLFRRAVDQQAQTLLAQTVSSPPRTAPPPQATMLPDHAGAAPVGQTETPRSGTKGLMSRLRGGPAQSKR
jgi:hypothetical protein